MLTVAVSNFDLARALNGNAMTVHDDEGNEVCLRLMTPDEAYHAQIDARQSLESMGASAPEMSDAEMRAHARLLTRPIAV